MSEVNIIDCNIPYNKAISIAQIVDPNMKNIFNQDHSIAEKLEDIFIYHFDILRLIRVSFKLTGEDRLGEVLKCSYDDISDVDICDLGDGCVYFHTSLYIVFMMAETSEVFDRFKYILDNEQVAYASNEVYTENEVDVVISCIDVMFLEPNQTYATIQIAENNESTYEFIKSLRAQCYIRRNAVVACFGSDCTVITAPRYVWENRLCNVVNIDESKLTYELDVIGALRNQWKDFLDGHLPNLFSCTAPTTEDINAGLKFDTVLSICINGALIARSSWASGDMVRYVPAGNYFKQGESINTNIPAMFIRMHENAPDEIWFPTTDDMIADDWIVYTS